MAESDLSSRIEWLETKFAYQEKLIEELNALVADQQKTIDALSLKMREAFAQIEDQREKADRMPHEKPPHY